MRASVLQEELLRALSIVSHFASPRAQVPVLANILFSAKQGKLAITATNLEMGARYQVGAKIGKEGETTIPARLAFDLVSNLPAGRLEIEEKEGQLHFSAGGFSGAMATLPASEFPAFPKSTGEETLSLTRETVLSLASQVAFAAAQDETRPALTGILLLLSDGLQAVATDGFRLSYKELTGQKPKATDQRVLLPARALLEIAHALGEKEAEIKISFLKKEGQVLFSSDSLTLTSRLLEGEFPDFERILPKETGHQATLDKEQFLRAVKAAAVFAREGANIVKISIGDGKILVRAESQQYGKEEAVVDAKTEGGEIEAAFNFRYLLEFLASTQGDEISFSMDTATSPGLFADPKDSTYRHLIMPVRIQT